jgi:hypothetical protein
VLNGAAYETKIMALKLADATMLKWINAVVF